LKNKARSQLKIQSKFWLFVSIILGATFVVLVGIGISFWNQLSPDQHDQLMRIAWDQYGYIILALTFFFIVLGFCIDWVFKSYIVPVNQLADEVGLIDSVNSTLRVQPSGSRDVIRLGNAINRFAQHQNDSCNYFESELMTAKAATEAERNILASLLQDLSLGILICNLNGRIVFFNRKIQALLSRHPSQSIERSSKDHISWIGLDRSIYGIIDEALLNRCLETIKEKLLHEKQIGSERFLIRTQSKSLLSAELVPVIEQGDQLGGYIIVVEDQRAAIQRENEICDQLLDWKHEMTQSVAALKSISEVLQDQPENNGEEHQELIRILSENADIAASLLSHEAISLRWRQTQPWPLTAVDLDEWIQFLAHRTRELSKVHISAPEQCPSSTVNIDMHHLSLAMVFVFDSLLKTYGVQNSNLMISTTSDWVSLDFSWTGEKISLATLKQWKASAPRIESEMLINSLSEILDAHGAKLWIGLPDLPVDHGGLRLLLPRVEDAELKPTIRQANFLSDGRPEFFDFDLFRPTGYSDDVKGQLLTKLAYTVFDTETTGLDPIGGDEIISIGAIRIVNGSLLTEEHFDQLIDPQRPITWSSIKYHGIRPEMVEGQPTIDQVLPHFFNFAKDTVLVGHNVAFDLRMLQLKEAKTHVRFQNPVLDTMLLSAVVHPNHPKHTLDIIAQRLGVNMERRHTALGDAITAGRIFLMLLPILASMGIHTLADALNASKKTYYARLKY
jgi:DNA polymerase-3 subunit epsilon